MNALIPANFGAVSQVALRAAGLHSTDDDLSAGVSSGFPVMSIKGKAWTIKHRGVEKTLMREDGDGTRGSVEVVIIKASPAISKIFYEQGYQEGSTEAPDCWSTNGLTPDAAAPKKQHTSCAACPQNAWGSKMTAAGKAGKACADSRRIAIVPLADIDNDVYGGPMLLRIPAASLQELAQFGSKMKALGYPYFAIGTRLSFDAKEAYPKLVFSAIRPLTDDEAARVVGLMGDDRTARVLSEGVEARPVAITPAAPSLADVFEQPPAPAASSAGAVQKQMAHTKAALAAIAAEEAAELAQAAPVAAPAPEPVAEAPAPVQAAPAAAVAAAKPKPAPKPAPAPEPVVAEPVEEGEAPADFDDLLSNLMGE